MPLFLSLLDKLHGNTTHGVIKDSDNSEDYKHCTVCPWWQMKENLSSRSAMISRQLQKEDWINKQAPHTAANDKARFPFRLCEVVHFHNPTMQEAKGSLGHIIRFCLKQNKTNNPNKQNIDSVRLSCISYAVFILDRPWGLFISVERLQIEVWFQARQWDSSVVIKLLAINLCSSTGSHAELFSHLQCALCICTLTHKSCT